MDKQHGKDRYGIVTGRSKSGSGGEGIAPWAEVPGGIMDDCGSRRGKAVNMQRYFLEQIFGAGRGRCSIFVFLR